MNYSFFIKESDAEQIAHDYLRSDLASAELSPLFRFYYQLRSFIPLSVRQWLQSRRPVEVCEAWYVNDRFMRSLAACIQMRNDNLVIVHPWPDDARFAFVLTHDVETREGLQDAARIADMEEELGFRSSWNLIPYKYKIDDGLVKDLVSRGFEIGIHGYNHDGKLYMSERIFRRRAKPINEAVRRYGAVGFRSPMVHRNLQWLQMLDIEYDASCFDIDPYQAMPGGVGSIWPFTIGKFVELPYTLPQDHTLFIARGERDCSIWHQKLDFVVRHHGMALMLTHPDYLGALQRNLYQQFLRDVRDAGGFWHALPKDVMRWWIDREQSRVQLTDLDQPVVAGPASHRGRCCQLSACNGELQLSEVREERPNIRSL